MLLRLLNGNIDGGILTVQFTNLTAVVLLLPSVQGLRAQPRRELVRFAVHPTHCDQHGGGVQPKTRK